jgi:hypothetical protein
VNAQLRVNTGMKKLFFWGAIQARQADFDSYRVLSTRLNIHRACPNLHCIDSSITLSF